MTFSADAARLRTMADQTLDGLSLAALVSLGALVSFLVLHASANPLLAPVMPMIDAGLIVASLLLMRQWKKGRNAERASRAGAVNMRKRDPATQLLNAEGFAELLGQQTGGGALAVLVIQLDRLKDVHDRLGDECGDEVLRELAGRLTSVFGPNDVVGRIGEDRLALFHPSTDAVKLAVLGGQVNKLMSLPVMTPAGEVVIGSTLGVNFIDLPVADARDAIRQARLANGAARASGGEIAFFEPGLDHAQRLKLDLEVELRQALQTGGLEMVYQPQIDETGATIGVEALMRWPHPTRGAIPPGVFVPVAEGAGLGEALGRYAIDRAFEDSIQWPGLRVAINVSPIQLRSPAFVETVRDLVAQHRVRPSGFEFEITEGVLIEADAPVLETLEQLRRMGFQIALDDFGTGYSSLSYLGRFPIDKIKIDRSFVTPLGVRRDAASIIRAISDLSDALGVKVLAEGVETRSQLDMLRAEGCNQAQGFFVGKPMAPVYITERFVAPERGRRKAA